MRLADAAWFGSVEGDFWEVKCGNIRKAGSPQCIILALLLRESPFVLPQPARPWGQG